MVEIPHASDITRCSASFRSPLDRRRSWPVRLAAAFLFLVTQSAPEVQPAGRCQAPDTTAGGARLLARRLGGGSSPIGVWRPRSDPAGVNPKRSSSWSLLPLLLMQKPQGLRPASAGPSPRLQSERVGKGRQPCEPITFSRFATLKRQVKIILSVKKPRWLIPCHHRWQLLSSLRSKCSKLAALAHSPLCFHLFVSTF